MYIKYFSTTTNVRPVLRFIGRINQSKQIIAVSTSHVKVLNHKKKIVAIMNIFPPPQMFAQY